MKTRASQFAGGAEMIVNRFMYGVVEDLMIARRVGSQLVTRQCVALVVDVTVGSVVFGIHFRLSH